MDELIHSLSLSGYGCFVGKTFFGCIMYADDRLLLSPSLHGLQAMLDICSVYADCHNLVFNPTKTTCSVVGRNRLSGKVSQCHLLMLHLVTVVIWCDL